MLCLPVAWLFGLRHVANCNYVLVTFFLLIYAQTIGKPFHIATMSITIYFSIGTRSDIAFAIGALSKFISNPSWVH